MEEKPDEKQRVSREKVQEMLHRCAEIRGVRSAAPKSIQQRSLEPIVLKSQNDHPKDI